jgi:hypothetical protein
MKKVLTILFIIHIISFPLRANLDSLLTGIETINKLKLVETPHIYVSNDLFVMIDGGAETYLEYGFNRALDAVYTFDSTKRIGVQIYEMTDDGAAFGILTSTINDGDHSLQIGDYSFGNNYYIMTVKGIFFIMISCDDNSMEMQTLLSSMGKCIASNIKEKTILPELVTKSLSVGYSIENMKYIRGKIALSGNYFFGHKDIFNTRDAIYFKENDYKVFVFQYPDIQTSTLNLNRVREELISSGRYTQFNLEDSKFNCLDKNLKFIRVLTLNKYLIATVGKEPDEEFMKKIYSVFQ